MMQGGPPIDTYCVFCRTGSEQAVAQAIQQNDPEVQAIAPQRILTEKRQGQWIERPVTLLPGYVFLYTQRELPIKQKAKARNLYKVLEYEHGVAKLTGQDEEYALWIYRHQGAISPSKVLEEGDQVIAIEGPLKDCSGKIVKKDRHKRRIWVEFEFDKQKRTVSLSAEWVERATVTDQQS